MEKQVLSIEQMQKLKELGVDTSRASIYWMVQTNGRKINDKSNLNKPFLSLHKEYLVAGFMHYEVIPTFTLQDMIEMMPKRIGSYTLSIYVSQLLINYDKIGSFDSLENLSGFEFDGEDESLLDIAFTMLCSLAEKDI